MLQFSVTGGIFSVCKEEETYIVFLGRRARIHDKFPYATFSGTKKMWQRPPAVLTLLSSLASLSLYPNVKFATFLHCALF